MITIHIDSNTTARDIQRAFSNEFPGLTIVLYQTADHPNKGGRILKQISGDVFLVKKMDVALPVAVSFRKSDTVLDTQSMIHHITGLHARVFLIESAGPAFPDGKELLTLKQLNKKAQSTHSKRIHPHLRIEDRDY